ncbi:MAG: DUF4340 domain-containing protein [Sandaracinaceae bacterium]
MDWQRFRLPIMGVLAIVMVGATWWAVNENTGDTVRETPAGETSSLPEVDTDALTEITIFRPEEDETITLTRDGDSWRLTAPVESSAAQTAVNTVLDKLGDLDVAGRAASTAAHHEDMEVDAGHGIRVTANAGSDTVIDLYIGAFRAGNTLVRQEGQDEVLMVRGSIKFAFNKPPRDFRDRSMTELTVGEVSHIAFENENGRFAFFNDGTDWQQNLTAAEGEEPPAAIEDFAGAKVRTMVSSLARLRASDFAASDATPESLGFGEGAARVILGMTPEAEEAEGEEAEEAEGEEAEGEETEGEETEGTGAARGPDSVPESTLTLTVGNEESDGKRYVMVEGNDTVFIVSRFIAERLLPEAEAFTASAEEPTPPPAAGGGMPPGMPPGMGGPGGPGGGQIPPELMQQIQRQLQQQGAGGGGGHP